MRDHDESSLASSVALAVSVLLVGNLW